MRLSRGCCPAGSSVKERGQIQIPPFPPPCGAQTKEGHSYSSITPNSRPRGCGEDSLLVARSGYRAALNGSELRRNAGRVMPARGACTRQTATEGGTRRGRVNTPVLVGEVRGSGAERPRLVQAQCWCPRDVGREGWCVALTIFQFSSARPEDRACIYPQVPLQRFSCLLGLLVALRQRESPQRLYSLNVGKP